MSRAISFLCLAAFSLVILIFCFSGCDEGNQAPPTAPVQAQPKRVDWSKFTTVDAVKRAVIGKSEDEVREILGGPDDAGPNHKPLVNGILTDTYWVYGKRITNTSTGRKLPVWVYFLKGKVVLVDVIVE